MEVRSNEILYLIPTEFEGDSLYPVKVFPEFEKEFPILNQRWTWDELSFPDRWAKPEDTDWRDYNTEYDNVKLDTRFINNQWRVRLLKGGKIVADYFMVLKAMNNARTKWETTIRLVTPKGDRFELDMEEVIDDNDGLIYLYVRDLVNLAKSNGVI